MSKYAKLRVCASCEWMFKISKEDQVCPKCNFASYGARYAYGNACYRFAVNQKPWMDKKMADYATKLYEEIERGKL